MRRKKKTTWKQITPGRAAWIIVIGACVLAGAVLLMNMGTPPGAVYDRGSPQQPASPEAVAPAPTPEATPESPPTPEPVAEATPVAPPPTLPAPGTEDAIPSKPPAPAALEPASEADFKYLQSRDLLIPVEGVSAAQLRDSYYDGRSEGRTHEALDIMAALDTPVLATTDGKVAKLFQSDKGGIALYQLDESGLYYFYYAHLSRYADGVYEGKPLKRGEIIGYVGDTGNAGAGNYHLHFGIQKPKAPGKWSGGFPINPYPLLNH
ncbi:MAG TPA: M23 family metallopeptidase [Blastocatellia bacterium]|nr:M23 family metallopeptidase [Blastocatellia bacterium]